MKKQLLLLPFCFGLFLYNLAQITCGCQAGVQTNASAQPEPGPQPAPGCVNAYHMNISNYLTLPIRYVDINFHVIQNSVATPENFTNADVNVLNDIFNQLNDIYANVQTPVWPAPGVQNVHIPDSRIRFNLNGIYFHLNDGENLFDMAQDFNGTRRIEKYGVDIENTINIFFCDAFGIPKLGGVASQIPKNRDCGYLYVTQRGAHSYILQDPGGLYGVKVREVAWYIAHELAHNLGLPHTFQEGQSGLVEFQDTPAESNCFCPPSSGSVSNNLMQYDNAYGSYISPLQIAWMHKNLVRNPVVRRYTHMNTCTYSQAQSETIQGGQNLTWAEDRHIGGDLIVKSGSRLTIRCAEITFVEESKVIIERGAELILDGAVLTTKCNVMWKGIEVWGNPNVPQSQWMEQGKLVMRNGAEIANARDAIATTAWDGQGNRVWNYTGGAIIQCEDAYFGNNKRSAEFMRYHSYYAGYEVDNVSYFKDCWFDTCNFLEDPSYNIGGKKIANTAHVTLWEVKGIKFQDCTFRNLSHGNYKSIPGLGNFTNIRGRGIHAVDANFKVDGGDFVYLTYGVQSVNNSVLGQSFIENANFEETHFPIWNSGGGLLIADKNIINNKKPGDDPDPSRSYAMGITSLGSHVIRITSNDLFKGSAYSVPFNYGILIENTLSGGYLIDNYFEYGYIGLQTQKNNPVVDITCNESKNPEIGFAINPQSPAAQLPNRTCFISGTNYGQGNKFNITNSTFPYKDIYHPFPSVGTNPFLYVYSGTNLQAPDGSYSGPDVSLSRCVPNDAIEDPDCPYSPPGGGGGNQNTITSLSGLYDFYKRKADSLNAIVDGNQTQTLLAATLSPGTPGIKKNQLVQQSPWLSDTVLIAAISPASGLPPGHILEIVIANSPLTPRAMTAVIDRNLPNGIMNQIEAAQSGISARQELEGLMGYYLQQMLQVEADLMLLYLSDSTGTSGIDSVIALFGRDESLRALQLGIPTLIQTGRVLEAQALLNFLPSTSAELAAFKSLQSLLLNLKSGNRSIFELTATEKQSLEYLALSGTPAGFYAQGVLDIVYGNPLSFEPEPIVLNNALRGMQEEPSEEPFSGVQIYSAYPNPSNGIFNLPVQTESAEIIDLKVVNSLGQIIWTLQADVSGYSEIELDITSLSSGIYFLEISNLNSTLAIQKLIISE